MADQPRKKKRPADINRLAKSIVDDATSDEPEEQDEGNPTAAEYGRQGGLIGGRRAAENMTPDERSERAQKAAVSRWAKDKS